MLLAPCLALLALFLLGSLRVAAGSQARVALQARADLCAVRLAVARERLLDRLARSNGALELTVKGITAARAAMLVPGAGAAAAEAEKALLLANASIARAQDSLVAVAAAREAAALSCAPDSWSRAPVFCLADPPGLSRLPTPFPDVRGRLALHRPASRVRCASGRLGTTLEVRGDPFLGRSGYHDAYVE